MKRIVVLVALTFLFTRTLTAQHNFWEQTNGPPAVEGSFYFGSIGMNSLGHIFASSLNGFVYRSTDDGYTWKAFNVNAELHCLTINSKGYIFVGAWSYGGVFRSTDNGETWVKTNCPSSKSFGLTWL